MNGSYVDMIVGHLNAPYGPVVSHDDVVAAFRAGNLAHLAMRPTAQGVLSALFVECEPSLIGEACHQERISLQRAHDLYKSLRATHATPEVYAWEEAMKEVAC